MSPRQRSDVPVPSADVFRTRTDDRWLLTDEARTAIRPLVRRSRRAGWVTPLSYNVSISHSHKFLWYRVAKVASRTVRGHFIKNGVELDVDHAMRIHYPWETFADYYTFAFVRDPLERFVSAWRSKVVKVNYFGFDEATLARMQRVEEFAQWAAGHDLGKLPAADQHIALQSRLIDLNRVDFVGRLENFDADFAEVCRHIGTAAAPASPLNQTASSGSTTEVSAELRELVETMYRRDYQIFGY